MQQSGRNFAPGNNGYYNVKTSIVVTAEGSPPVYPTEQQALAVTGSKTGSGRGSRWAVWITKGDSCQLLAHDFPGLRQAEEYALNIAKELATAEQKVTRVC